jgi:hypothetical protein
MTLDAEPQNRKKRIVGSAILGDVRPAQSEAQFSTRNAFGYDVFSSTWQSQQPCKLFYKRGCQEKNSHTAGN